MNIAFAAFNHHTRSLMFKIYPELKTIPSWFNDFDIKKLIDHPVDSVKYLIWLIQLGTLISVFFAIALGFTTMFAAGGAFAGTLVLMMVVTFGFSQVLILGIHARSRLAWLLLVSMILRSSFSFMFIGGLIAWYLLDQDETLNYFNGLDPCVIGNEPTSSGMPIAQPIL
jgi:hypothetical protein